MVWFGFYETGSSLCSYSWPGTYHVDQDDVNSLTEICRCLLLQCEHERRVHCGSFIASCVASSRLCHWKGTESFPQDLS